MVLSHFRFTLGLISKERFTSVVEKYQRVDLFVDFLKNCPIDPDSINPFLVEKGSALLTQRVKAYQLVLRPQIFLHELVLAHPSVTDFMSEHKFSDEEVEAVEIMIKYKSYIEKEYENAQKLTKFDNIKIPENTDYFSFSSLSWEAREKLSKIKPATIGQASRISGVSPSDISVLLVFFGR